MVVSRDALEVKQLLWDLEQFVYPLYVKLIEFADNDQKNGHEKYFFFSFDWLQGCNEKIMSWCVLNC